MKNSNTLHHVLLALLLSNALAESHLFRSGEYLIPSNGVQEPTMICRNCWLPDLFPVDSMMCTKVMDHNKWFCELGISEFRLLDYTLHCTSKKNCQVNYRLQSRFEMSKR